MKPSERVRELGLNGLLALLVGLSILLSAQVWFPSDRSELGRTKDPRVQATPISYTRSMPDLFRAERIIIRTENGAAALLPTDTDAYRRTWPRLQQLLTSLVEVGGPHLVDYEELSGESVTLVLPIALTLGEWVERWGWNGSDLRNVSMKVDRLTFTLGPEAGIYLAGPQGSFYRVGSVTPSELEQLRGLRAGLDPALFAEYRPLEVEGSRLRFVPGLLVPTARQVPVGVVKALKPDEKAEEARYFPDLSVIRQIDERDARGFTDGQRFLRITSGGVLEFRAASTAGTAPELSRALNAARDWLDARSAWSSEYVLSQYVQQPGKTTLLFDVRGRGLGPYPVETNQGALQVEVASDRANASAQRVISLKRLPDFWATFEEALVPIITPEQALQRALEEYPRQMLFDLVREMHIAYHLKQADGWRLEPVWVLQVGEARLYIPAAESSKQPYPQADPKR